MKLKTIVTNCAVVSMFTFTMVSCQKSADLKVATPTTTVDKEHMRQAASLQTLLMADDNQQDQFALNAASLQAAVVAAECPMTVTYDNPPGVYPRTVTVDYGPVDCYNVHNQTTRRGKVMTTYYGDMADSGQYYIQTYDNYYVDTVHIEGELKMAHVSRKKDPQNTYRKTFINRTITEVNGDVYIYNGDRRLVKKQDDGTYPGPIYIGNFRVTGSVSASVSPMSGAPYTWVDSVDKAQPLLYRDCIYPGQGVLITSFSDGSVWTVDYGLGGCDTQATLSIDGSLPVPVTLPLIR